MLFMVQKCLSYASCFHCSDGHTHIGLITLVMSLAGEAPVAGDLGVQQNILTVASNILTGKILVLFLFSKVVLCFFFIILY